MAGWMIPASCRGSPGSLSRRCRPQALQPSRRVQSQLRQRALHRRKDRQFQNFAGQFAFMLWQTGQGISTGEGIELKLTRHADPSSSWCPSSSPCDNWVRRARGLCDRVLLQFSHHLGNRPFELRILALPHQRRIVLDFDVGRECRRSRRPTLLPDPRPPSSAP